MRSKKKGSTPFEGCSLSMKRLMAASDRLSCCPFRLPAAEREQLQGSRMCRRMLRASVLSAGRSRQRGQKQSAARMRKKRRAARAMRLGRLDGLSSSFDPSRRRRTSQQAAWPPASLKALRQSVWRLPCCFHRNQSSTLSGLRRSGGVQNEAPCDSISSRW